MFTAKFQDGIFAVDENQSDTSAKFTQRDVERPLVFMHIPKCGGTSLDVSLMAALGITEAKRFFGTVLHGSLPVETYASWEKNSLDHVAIDETMFLQDSAYTIAHASYQELLFRHPNGQFITFLREPVCRLLSLRTFLRTFSDQMICHFGHHGMTALRARLPLCEFLGHPYYAAGCDNVVIRMLLHGDERIPPHSFIDPAHDAGLLADASRKIGQFDGVFAMEDDGLASKLSNFFGSAFSLVHENESLPVPDHLACDLGAELNGEALDLLNRHSRLDLHLWKSAMGMETDHEMHNRRVGLIARCVARHGSLLSARSN